MSSILDHLELLENGWLGSAAFVVALGGEQPVDVDAVPTETGIGKSG